MRRSTSQAIIAITLILMVTGLMVLSLSGHLAPLQGLILRPFSGIQSWIALRVAATRGMIKLTQRCRLVARGNNPARE